ncbi:hypothetical protein BHM03_00028436 [Ensete ventricosum]|nr:hypothetical protein BHM03_00028436 [Ensete ventricosum]
MPWASHEPELCTSATYEPELCISATHKPELRLGQVVSPSSTARPLTSPSYALSKSWARAALLGHSRARATVLDHSLARAMHVDHLQAQAVHLGHSLALAMLDQSSSHVIVLYKPSSVPEQQCSTNPAPEQKQRRSENVGSGAPDWTCRRVIGITRVKIGMDQAKLFVIAPPAILLTWNAR